MSSLKYWVWLAEKKGMGSAAKLALVQAMGGPDKVFFADEEALRLQGLSAKALEALRDKSLGETARILDRCREAGIRILAYGDSDYPERLKNIYNPPPVLYLRGRLPAVDEEAAVALVGTRKCTPYGLRMAEQLGYELAREGCLVVTGLARGIDTAAAKGALRGGGRVLGVIGSGPDVVYPPENKELFEDVLAGGAILSEYPPETGPSPHHFPARNRILSGLSLGVAVIEAPEKSGALITAARALEQGRDVFVLPANVDSPFSAGSNRLLRDGAIPILCGRHVAEEYRELYPDKLLTNPKAEYEQILGQEAGEGETDRPAERKKRVDKEKPAVYDKISGPVFQKPQLAPEEDVIYSLLNRGSLHVNDIIEQSGMTGGAVLAALTMLEIKNLVKQLPGKHFCLTAGIRK